jgi:hypothetical protein
MEFYRDYSITFWGRFWANDGTILSFRDMPVWDGQSEIALTSNSDRWAWGNDRTTWYEVYLNSAGYFTMATEGDYQSPNTHYYDGQW